MKVKTKIKKLFFLYFSSFVTLTSCEQDYEEPIESLRQTQPMQFEVRVPFANELCSAQNNGASINSIPELDQIVITIKKEKETLYNHKVLQLFKTHKGPLFSKALLLTPGDYTLEEYTIKDKKGLNLYKAPYKNEDRAKYVTHPLPLSFEVAPKNISQTLSPEVLPCSEFLEKLDMDILGFLSHWVYIPDDHFRAHLKTIFQSAFWGELMNPDDEKVKAAKRIDVKHKEIATLEGIQYFPAIEELYCSQNHLSTLDISKNHQLEILDCSNNIIKNLNVLGDNVLEELNCSQNHLSTLNISKNDQLKTLDCSNNAIKNLILINNAAIEKLNCSQNQLSILNIGTNHQLKILDCSNNAINKLDVNSNKELQVLHCDKNQLTELKLEANSALIILSAQENQLNDKLDLSNNDQLDELYCQNNELKNLDIKRLKKKEDDGKLKIYGSEKHNLKTLFVHDFSRNHQEFKNVKKINYKTIISTFDDDKKMVCKDYDPIEEKCKDESGDSVPPGAAGAAGISTGSSTIAGIIKGAKHHHSHSSSSKKTRSSGKKPQPGSSKQAESSKETKDPPESKKDPREKQEQHAKKKVPEKEAEAEAEEPTKTSKKQQLKEELKEVVKELGEEAKEKAKEEAMDRYCKSLSSPEDQALCHIVADHMGSSSTKKKKKGKPKLHSKSKKIQKRKGGKSTKSKKEGSTSSSSKKTTKESSSPTRKRQEGTEESGSKKQSSTSSSSESTKTTGKSSTKKRKREEEKKSGRKKQKPEEKIKYVHGKKTSDKVKRKIRKRVEKFKKDIENKLKDKECLSESDIKRIAKKDGLSVRKTAGMRSTTGLKPSSHKEATGKAHQPVKREKSTTTTQQTRPKSSQQQRGKRCFTSARGIVKSHRFGLSRLPKL